MVRELISLPFRVAGKVVEGALGLVRGGDDSFGPMESPESAPRTPPPSSSSEPRQSAAEPEQTKERSTSGRDPERSDWDEGAPVPPGGSNVEDNVLADKVSSEVLGRASAPKGEINLNVENGVVFLRGRLEDPEQVEEVVAAASQVEGVQRVENLIE